MLDIGLLLFFAIGTILGYWRGAFAGVILLVATYVPFFVFVYFFDFITGFVDGVLANSQDGTTAALGGLGAFSGIIALVGFMGSVFLGTRILLKITQIGQRDMPEKIGGAVVGFLGQNIAATLAFFLIYTAIPVKSSQFVEGSYWMQFMRPLHKATYPYYLAMLEERTQKLSLSIAQNGIGATMIGGVSIDSLNKNLGFDAPNLAAASTALKELSRNINLDEITDLLKSAEGEDISPEAVDRLIQEEQANRLRTISDQLR